MNEKLIFKKILKAVKLFYGLFSINNGFFLDIDSFLSFRSAYRLSDWVGYQKEWKNKGG